MTEETLKKANTIFSRMSSLRHELRIFNDYENYRPKETVEGAYIARPASLEFDAVAKKIKDNAYDQKDFRFNVPPDVLSFWVSDLRKLKEVELYQLEKQFEEL